VDSWITSQSSEMKTAVAMEPVMASSDVRSRKEAGTVRSPYPSVVQVVTLK